jgi:16S rRNA (guanine966-N2)-methyltransferase
MQNGEHSFFGPRTNVPPKSSSQRNAVRIIGGAWKRSVITFPSIEGLRPTPDRVRETVMNWLGQDLADASVLDAFAGTGAFALECASRGAARVVALDSHPLVVKTIAQHAQRLGGAERVSALRADAMHYINTCGAVFDVAFFDPPFDSNLYEKLAETAPQVLRPGGVLYIESPRELVAFGGLLRTKHGKAGLVHYHLFANEVRQ